MIGTICMHENSVCIYIYTYVYMRYMYTVHVMCICRYVIIFMYIHFNNFVHIHWICCSFASYQVISSILSGSWCLAPSSTCLPRLQKLWCPQRLETQSGRFTIGKWGSIPSCTVPLLQYFIYIHIYICMCKCIYIMYLLCDYVYVV